MGRTTLTDDEYERCLRIVDRVLADNPSVNNATLRQLAEIDFDQAIRFFNRAIEDGVLVREGKAQATRYRRL